MWCDVVEAEHVEDYKVRLVFKDGKTGVVDLRPMIEQGGVFESLRDIERFKRFRIHPELGVLAWDDQIDIAPEVLYSQATHTELPEWMER